MSTILKWGVAIIVLVGAGWLLWWSGWLKNTNSGAMQAAVATSTGTTTQTTSALPMPKNGMSVANDSSDTAVAQDATAIDLQMQALGKDTSRVTTSLNDKPITQSY